MADAEKHCEVLLRSQLAKSKLNGSRKGLVAMSFQKLQWLFPIAVTLHNSEEAIWLPAWLARHAHLVPVQPNPTLFRLAAALLAVAAFVITYLSGRKGRETVWAYLLFGYIVAMLANVFLPHLPASLVLRAYTPGVVTAVLINLPVMSLLAVRAVADGWVSGRKAVTFAIAVPLAIAAIIPALVLIG